MTNDVTEESVRQYATLTINVRPTKFAKIVYVTLDVAVITRVLLMNPVLKIDVEVSIDSFLISVKIYCKNFTKKVDCKEVFLVWKN